MTDTGKLVLTIYSIIVLILFITKDLKKGDKGWKAAFLIPVLILLMNM